MDANRKEEFLNEIINTMIVRNASNTWQCTKCSYNSQRKENVTNHIEAKHMKTDGFNCDMCGKLHSTRNALRVHKIRTHSKSMATII